MVEKILDLLKQITSSDKEKSHALLESLGIQGWSVVEKMNQDELMELESKLRKMIKEPYITIDSSGYSLPCSFIS